MSAENRIAAAIQECSKSRMDRAGESGTPAEARCTERRRIRKCRFDWFEPEAAALPRP